MEHLNFRNAMPEDIPFIKSSWLKNQSYNVPFKKMRPPDFFKWYSHLIESLLERPNIKILIACNPDYLYQVYGYVVTEDIVDIGMVIHFIYIKGPYRDFKISREMLLKSLNGKIPIYYTHLSDNENWAKIIKKLKMQYNPFLITGKNYD